MRGLLADVNVEGHLWYLRQLLEIADLWNILNELDLEFVTLGDVGLPHGIDDRSLWNHCQQDGWVLLTDNRNEEDADSLAATLADSWRIGQLPVLTLAKKSRFEHRPEYAKRVATDIAELLFGVANGEYLNVPRIIVPFGPKR
ncbi:MAG: hypothetical protein L0241_18155 [Planctomycetia bacterium]|nr:hypothetical protein [Planctomycetia bacterium]